jgi:fumarate reductase flavoprotein subunit
MGAEPRVLKATINEYNAVCDAGYDPIFGKDRRFLKTVAHSSLLRFESSSGHAGNRGRYQNNEHMELIDKNNRPVPGLFSVGNDTGGWEPDNYNINLSGSTMGFAINSGRIAGENAAKYGLAG